MKTATVKTLHKVKGKHEFKDAEVILSDSGLLVSHYRVGDVYGYKHDVYIFITDRLGETLKVTAKELARVGCTGVNRE